MGVQYEIAGDLRPLTRPDLPLLTVNALTNLSSVDITFPTFHAAHGGAIRDCW
jgi:hypothetical protein